MLNNFMRSKLLDDHFTKYPSKWFSMMSAKDDSCLHRLWLNENEFQLKRQIWLKI